MFGCNYVTTFYLLNVNSTSFGLLSNIKYCVLTVWLYLNDSNNYQNYCKPIAPPFSYLALFKWCEWLRKILQANRSFIRWKLIDKPVNFKNCANFCFSNWSFPLPPKLLLLSDPINMWNPQNICRNMNLLLGRVWFNFSKMIIAFFKGRLMQNWS